MKTQFGGHQVRIVGFPATSVAILEHRGDPALLGDSVRRFIAWRRQAKLPPQVSATFNILYGDPDTTTPEEFRLDLCASTTSAVSPNEYGVIAGLIPSGRCAVIRLVGDSDNLGRAISFLYAVWLPASGQELRDFPVFVQRVSFFPDVSEKEAITKVYLPLQ